MKLSRAALKSWPIVAAVLGLGIVAALGLAYWSSIGNRERYLQSRNFRLLAVLASQTENLIDNRARIVRQALNAAPATGTTKTSLWLSTAATSLQDTVTVGDPWLEGPHTVALRVKAELRRYTVSVAGEAAALRISWRPPDAGSLPTIGVTIPAAQALSGIFEPKLRQGAFDTIVLAAIDGRVVYAVGRREAEMHAMSVAALIPPTDKGRADFGALADVISEQRVRIAGVPYRMFIQPCCRGDAPVSAAAPAAGLVVVGLAESEAMRAASWAISPVLVLAGVALVLAALVSWAFLKMTLMGPQQRVTPTDVLQLGASSVFGLALATILLLTAGAYARLSVDVDTQLERLADLLHESFSDEVTGAYSQAAAMTEHLVGHPCLIPVTGNRKTSALTMPPDPCPAESARMVKEGVSATPGYPGFTAFALIDASGRQVVKVANDAATSRRISVAERGYFLEAKSSGGPWQFAQCPSGCVLESHWSWTTGKPQVVLSMPTGIHALPVAALSIPMRALIAPVLPPGFEFAVISGDGRVQFHSDAQRNVHENLLLETDQNPRLRSIIAAHAAGAFNTSYWGRPYRAYVRPAVVPGWSIVALSDKQPARALVLEWSAVSLLLQTAFTLLCIGAMLIALKAGWSWMWPDPLRRRWYPALTTAYAAALVCWIIVAGVASVRATVIIGVLLPIGLWIFTYVVLAKRPPGAGQVEGWSELCRDYRVAGTLLLVVTAVVPGASFFAFSYDLHQEGYLKYRQIARARAADERVQCASIALPGSPVAASFRYDDVFHDSGITCAAESAATIAAGERRVVHSVIEDYLPYFTSASIDLRELMHDRADDGTWASHRPSSGQLAVSVAARKAGYRLAVLSPLPPLLAIRALGDDSRLVWAALVALLLFGGVVACAYWIVGYLLRQVVLADIVEPVRANGQLVTAVGQHVLVNCDNPGERARRLTNVYILDLMPIVQADNMAAAWRKARVAVGEAAPVLRLAIPDVDEQMEDLALIRRKMELIEELMGDPEQTVLLLSTVPPSVLGSLVREASKGEADPDRWPRLISRLTVIDERTSDRAAEGASSKGGTSAGWRSHLSQLINGWTGARPSGGWREELIATEGRPSRTLERICRELQATAAFQSGSLIRDQILEEIEERAAPLYRREWQACDGEERVVLEHVARHGLASAASRRVVRRLLARGLMRKDPELRLMNHSFQRFVLALERRKEVAMLEGLAEPSVWDRLRVPLGLAAVVGVVFLLTTQAEALATTVAMAAGVTTAVPTLMKLTNVLTQLGGKDAASPKV